MEPHRQSNPGMKSQVDLQLATLHYLPTPIIVLSSTHEIAFANRAVKQVLANSQAYRSSVDGILGQTLDRIGLTLLGDRSWDNILCNSLKFRDHGGQDGDPLDEICVALFGNISNVQDTFRVTISTVPLSGGVHFVLSFEKSPLFEAPPSPEYSVCFSQSEIADSGTKCPKAKFPTTEQEMMILRLKQAVFDNSTFGAYMVSADATLYIPNRNAKKVLGDIMGSCDGQSYREEMPLWDETFSRRIKPEEYPLADLVKRNAAFKNCTYGAINRTTGERILVNMNGECLYDDTGVLIGGLCWWSNVQGHSVFLAEQKQLTLESHETICNMMPNMIWSADSRASVSYFSQRWYEFTGLTKEESLDFGYFAAIHPDDIPVMLKNWSEWVQGERKDFTLEIRYRRHDGIYRWMLAKCCTLNDEDGKPIKWYGSTTDIHEIVMSRIAAATQKEEMLKVLAHGDVNVYSIGADKMVEWAEGGMPCMTSFDEITEGDSNHHTTSLLGMDAIEAAQARQPGGVPGYEKNILDILSGKIDSGLSIDPIGSKLYKTRLVAKHEHNPLDGARNPIIKGILGLSIDVTDMKIRADLEVDNTRLALEEQAAKKSNKIKSYFLANMSHEMRTPTAGVIGMVDLLSEDPNLTSEQREYVNSIQLSARALLTIVNDILDFSKIESGRLDIEEVPFKLSENVGGLIKLLDMFAVQKGLELKFVDHIGPDLGVLGDPGRTRQVLSNLLTNALKFTKKGRVTLTVTSTPIPSESEETIEVKFSVEDTGIGIEKHVLEKLFQPFSQGDSSTARLFGGTGLGLTISQNLAFLMNGSITLTSVPGNGSIATFTLPYKVCRQEILNKSAAANARAPPFSTFNPGISPTARFWSPPLAQRPLAAPMDEKNVNKEVHSTVTSAPAQRNEPTAIEDSSESTMQLSREERKKIHILVVEDNAINQKIALTNIRKLHFSVSAAWNGREALSYVLSPSPERPRPDIILMDIQMPQMDGYEATRLLREFGRSPTTETFETELISPPASPSMHHEQENGAPTKEFMENIRVSVGQFGAAEREKLGNIPVIAMTASAIQGDQDKCVNAGMNDYLSKPVDRGRLEEMLVKWALRAKRRPG